MKYFQHRGDIKGKKNAIGAGKLLKATDDIAKAVSAVRWLMENNFHPTYRHEVISELSPLGTELRRLFPDKRNSSAFAVHKTRRVNGAPFFGGSLIAILDDWNMSKWVLGAGWRFFRARRLRKEFPAAVERLWNLAGSWYVEAVKWKQYVASHDERMEEVTFKHTKQYAEAYSAFLRIKQEIHVHVEPMAFAYKDDGAV